MISIRAASIGVRRIFSKGGGSKGFSQNFFQGAKSGEIWFLPLEIAKKQPFLLIISKSRVGQGPLCPPFRRLWLPDKNFNKKPNNSEVTKRAN